jgi:TRAP-type C4-dicarboxylate transport system permease small subunit
LEKIKNAINKTAKMLDYAAGLLIVITMIITVSNIVLRIVFKNPILGTYEYTGFLAALIIGLGISYCAIQNGHIAVDFIIDKFPEKLRKRIDIITKTITAAFLGFFTWRVFVYAGSLMRSNEVSPTTRTPFFYFIYIIGACFLLLSVVMIFKVIDWIKEGNIG